ncbi:MAG: VCBS repeat-containing protein [Cyclobacteriaceae bacterium]|nr:VCBS repeat-containing protein [Cyclobacteriaceae bacterium]
MGCSPGENETLFSDVTYESGIDFINTLNFTQELNPYTYRNFYNGAGVAIGDINNDGLPDIYLTGNQAGNKLFLNEGNLRFKDITSLAGVGCEGAWSTGVTLVDINADGFLDIYVCKSGAPDSPHRHNQLFVNNGDLTFTDRAAEYGLDIKGLSVQAAFFDYDKDGDLDCYLLTNSFKSIGHFDLVKDQREIPDPTNSGNKFFLNQGGRFVDFTEEAGIYRSTIGFGLGITLGDFNEDSWVDIFISNDFFERDYLYINNKRGGFEESLPTYFGSISAGSMGADFADLDNDGINELFVTEMLPDSLERRKTKILFDSWDRYQESVKQGYHYQFTRNTLQKKESSTHYSELGRMAGIAASEWSWGALLFDMDNDGRRDVFIANGIYKDLLDRDYLSYSGSDQNVRKILQDKQHGILRLIELMPSSSYINYAFRNDGQMEFTDVSAQWGLNASMFSSGAAYGDLDGDGDLDFIVSNINSPVVVYRNNTDTSTHKSIRVSLTSEGKNRFMVGAQVYAYVNGQVISGDNFTVRGYQSSVDPLITLGIGSASKVDSLVIYWPDGKRSEAYNLPANRVYKYSYEALDKRVAETPVKVKNSTLRLQKIDSATRHFGSGMSDFNRERLVPMMYSNETPALLKADINNDGISEIYLTGGKDQPGTFIHFDKGSIVKRQSMTLRDLSLPEETRGVFFDADGDGDSDYYFATGGRFFPKISPAQKDRIFLNAGNGEFVESDFALPIPDFSTSFVREFDFDRDGDIDLIVAERFDPFVYGKGGRGYLLQNNGSGEFRDVTAQYAPALLTEMMLTDGTVVDFDNDGWLDLVLIGDWMPILMLKNNSGKFDDVSATVKLSNTSGWWNSIESCDINADNIPDFILGNHGKNTFFKPGDRMYIADFDGNGSIEQIYCTLIRRKYYPVLDKDELISQVPSLKKNLVYYKDYRDKSIDDIFPESVLSQAKILEVDMLSSVMLVSGPAGYSVVELPVQAQYSPVYATLMQDLDGDGVADLLVGGNQYQVKPQFGRYDASQVFFFKGIRTGEAIAFSKGESLGIKGQVRDIEFIKVNNKKYLLFAKYDDALEIFQILD